MKKFIFILLAISLTSNFAQAKVCLKEAQNAKSQGISHLVVSFEGLASYFSGFVRRSLIRDLQKNYGDEFVSKNYSYTSSKTAAECVSDWATVFKTQSTITIIGHSFGGGIATFDLLQKIPNVRIQNVITLDPRSWTSDSNYNRNKNMYQFVIPKNVIYGMNFFQRGGMPGYKVENANNYQLTNTAHTRVPAHSIVYEKSVCLLFADCKK
jgi:pimeloyl-ACP methyl ester carboxylesterase